MKYLVYIAVIFVLNSVHAQFQKFEYSAEYWRPHYEPFSKEPYGGYMFHEMLINKFGEADYAVLPKEHDQSNVRERNQLYVLYTYSVFWRNSDYDAIYSMAYRGNDVVIIAEELPYDVTYDLIGYDFDLFQTRELQVQYNYEFNNEADQIELSYISNFDTYPYEFHEIRMAADSYDDDINYLSKTKRGTSTLAEFEVGEGHIYLCTTPMIFSNLYLKSFEGKDHFDWFFDRFVGKKLVIDYGSQTPTRIKKPRSDFDDDGAKGSVLEHVLENKSLLWAYVILMLMGLFYVIFKGKRRQSIVPLLPSDKNSSKEFVETVSELYLSKKQHRKLALQKARIFLHFVRNKYYLSGKLDDPEFQENLRIKSGVESELITRIFNSFKKADQSKVFSLSELTSLHQDIEEFYQNCN